MQIASKVASTSSLGRAETFSKTAKTCWIFPRIQGFSWIGCRGERGNDRSSNQNCFMSLLKWCFRVGAYATVADTL